MMKNRKIVTAVLATAFTGMVAGTSIQAQAADFDPVFYAQTYADVAAAFGTDTEALYNHYVNFGQKEGRIPFAGGQPGEVVDGIADTEVTDTTEVMDIAEVPESTTGLTRASFPWFTRRHDDCPICDYMEGSVEVITYGATEAQVKERLLALKEVYPDGMYLGYGCGGFSNKLKTALYGPASIHDPVKPTVRNKNVVKIDSVTTLDPGRVRTGDIIYTTSPDSPNGHVFMVLDHDDWGVTVVEANWNWDQKAHWGRRISWTDLDKVFECVEHYLY